ncbi:hypothetical protein TBLA_0F01670 [Henningerozyma blattae CBS 6284]|uniref:Uncharacterized protein n=1 Tax=Henningerozyma blattae (strain ATCC 34711 / CBS 6284 / DSM 70876 / NBRC 10599 / NRRL Y-10934 / UCD 77-7) TaxID=1071380 RepID=I2H5Q7_HENB6|nr:hypothetical protein TBLA_0F01670 [Tetrapisispora blattae CBS 6284]CCH61709.1 hypothetical protein TBLA_0F01670 [Tetrapisispora blattae CBS 6284]
MSFLEAKIGILSHVDGSSQLTSQSTNVICGVTGPIEPKPRQELPNELALEIIVRPATGVSNTREKLLEDRLRGVLTPIINRNLYPRQLCQITCQILDSGESDEYFSQKELACCINSSFLALIDAGIALNSTVASIVLAIMNDAEETIVTNPTNEQLLESKSVHILALEIVNESKLIKNVLLLDSLGDFTETQLFKILEIGEKSCVDISISLRKIIQDRVEQSIIR